MDFTSQKQNTCPVESFLLNTKAKTTKQSHRIILKCFCIFIFDHDDIYEANWNSISKRHILKFIEFKIENLKFNTVNNYLSVLQVFARECFNCGVIDSFTYNLIRDIRKYRGVAPDTGRALNLKEINKVKRYFFKSNSARELRNFAIFSLALGAGLRRAEISTINIEHIKSRELQVTGKGNKSRNVYLCDFTFNAITAWKKQLSNKRGALFVHVNRSDCIKQERLGIKGVHYVINEIQILCGLREFTTHDLRRTFATSLLYSNNDIFVIQDLLGHSDPMTTKRYDKRGESRKVKAIKSLPF